MMVKLGDSVIIGGKMWKRINERKDFRVIDGRK